MTITEWYQYFNTKIPPSLSSSWDNDGLMCCPDPAREVRRVLVALDVTAQVVDTALAGRYDLIVSHHPLIFKSLKALNNDSFVAEKTMRLIAGGISVMSFHTRLDAVAGGVNDILAQRLGLTDILPFGPDGESIGRIGVMASPTGAADFAAHVKRQLGAPFVLLADAGRSVHRIAVVGGDGKDFITAAKQAGADTYVSGRFSYNTMTDAPEYGINLIEAGHYFTEVPVCAALRDMMLSADPTLVCDLYDSNLIGTI